MAKKWADVASSDAFKALTPDQQDGARRQYFDQVVAPQVPEEHIELAWNQFSTDAGVGRRSLPAGVSPSSAGAGRGTGSDPRRLDAPRTERTWGEAASDTVKSIGQGLIDVGGVLPGVAYGAVTGDYDNALLNTARGMNEIIDETKSDVIKSRRQELQDKLALAEGWREKMAVGGIETLKDPALLGDTVARSAPGMLAGGVVGRAGGAGAELVGNAAIKGASTVASPMATAGLKVAQAAPAVASGTAVGSAATIQGASVASDTYEEAMKLPMEAYRAQDGFADLAAKVGEDKAKSMFASAAANRAGLVATAASLASMKLVPGGASIEKALLPKALQGAEQVVQRGTGSVFTRPLTQGMAGGIASKAAEVAVKGGVTAAEEGISEGLEEGTGAVAKSLETSRIDGTTPDLGETFGEAAGQAMPVGMLMGHAAGAHEAATSRPDFATREQQIKSLREGGDTAAADMLQQKHERMTAEENVDGELAKLPGNDAFAQHYREMRVNGAKPAEAAARSAVTVTFSGLAQATGIPDDIAAKAVEKAKGLPLEKIPSFYQRFTESLVAMGKIQPGEAVAAMGQNIQSARDEAMDAAVNSVYAPVQQAMDDVTALEKGKNQPLALADTEQAATENIATAAQEIDLAAHDAATSPLNNLPEPTDAQKAAGNYKVGRVTLHGLNISIENPEGSIRKGTSPDGTKWENELRAHYGYIRGTEGNDGDHVDTFIGPNPESQKVFVVDQVNKDGSFDEHKVLLGTDDLQQADDLYHANYHEGWTGRGAITEMSMDQFKAWVKDGKKTEPVGKLPGSTAKQTPASAGVPTSGAETSGAPVYLGRDSVSLADGGKAFKTRKAADDARKLNPMMRVVRAEGGYALTEKTPAQLAAQDAAAKRLRQPRTSPKGEPIPAHAMIAAAGGLSPDARADMGMQGNVQIGNRRLFAGDGKGLTIEQATEKLIEDGYLSSGASHDDARNLIKRSLTKPQYTAEGTERQAQAEAEARRQAYEDAVAEFEEASDNQFETADEDIPWDEPSNASEADFMRAMGFSEQEIEDATATRPGLEIQDRPNDGEIDAAPDGGSQAVDGQRAIPPIEDQGSRSDPRRQETPVTQTPSTEGVSVSGEFGPILTQYRHDAQGAIEALKKLQDGEAVAALHHLEVGDIDLVWGKVGTRESNGFGLAKIIKWHPEVLPDLQGFLNRLHKDEAHSGANRIRLTDKTGRAVVSLDWKGSEKVWLLTAYERRAEASTTMDTASIGSKGDTARLEPGSVQSVPTPAPEGNFATEPRADGTLVIKGDATAIQARLSAGGVTKTTPMNGGVMVGKSQAQQAQAIMGGLAPESANKLPLADAKPTPKPEALIELRKRESVLKALKECLGA